jgi:hypothetical protein
MADQSKPETSEPSDDGNPVLKLNAKELLEFVSKHTEADRNSFDRLLKWFWGAAAALVGIAGILATFVGIQASHDASTIREEAKAQIQAEVAKETNEQNIQKYISTAIEKRTEAQFQDAIAKAVTTQLETPERQKFLEATVQRQVDLWFTAHQQVLQTAAQRQVDILTGHLQNRDKILQLGAEALAATPKSGPALRELQHIAKSSQEETIKELARAQVAIISGFWGAGNSFLILSDHVKALDDKGLKPPYQTCALLELLHSPIWQDRAQSLDFLTIQEKGVPEALMQAMKDDYLEVAARASKAFQMVVIAPRPPELQNFFPDVDELQKWWVKDGQKATTYLKPLSCK